MQLKHRMKQNRKATHIQWDVDDLEDLELLPTEIDIPDDMTDMEEISDYITDQTGFCHNGFINGKSLRISQAFFCCSVSKIKFLSVVIVWKQSVA